MTPLVSAIIPCFNYGRFVERAIQSVLAQTWPHVECIVVDDGSTDETSSVLRNFDGRVRVIHQPHRGVSAARNAAIRVARGEYVAFLDGDDWWHPPKLQAQVGLLDARPAIGCAGCGLEHVYPDGRVERIPGKPNPHDRRAAHRHIALRRFWVSGSGSGAMVRRSVLDRVGLFDETLVAAEDWDLWLRIAAETDIANVDDILVSINRHGTGVFRNARLMAENQWQVYQRTVARWPSLLSGADRRRIKALILADAAGESPVRAEAVAYYMRSLAEWPFNYRRARAAASLSLRSLQAALPRRRASSSE